MRFRKLISAMIASVMLFTSLVIPANAYVDINAGGEQYTGWSGTGRADDMYSPIGLHNRFGYRVSIYYAPQKKDESGNWLYDDYGNPVYNWEKDGDEGAQPVGKTIDIFRNAPTNDDGYVLKPNEWGIWSVWDYLKEGGAYNYNKYKSKKHAFDGGPDYYYYQFSDKDRGMRDDENNYMCALFNEDTMSNYVTSGSVQEKLDADYYQIVEKLNAVSSTLDDDKKHLITGEDGTLDKLAESFNYVNGKGKKDLPLVNNQAEAKDEKQYNSSEELTSYLIHPTILNMLSDATGGNFTAEDFYFGTWNGPSGDTQVYPRGTFKIVIENLTIAGNGTSSKWLAAFTLADSLSMGDKGIVNGDPLWTKYGSTHYLFGIANTLRLDHPDSVLNFSGYADRYMGDKLDVFNKSGVTSDLHDYLIGKQQTVYEGTNHYSIDGILGNYSGLAVIDSDSIYSRADVSKGKIINEVMVSWIGDADLGVTGLQINMDANDLSTLLSEDDINDICAAFDNEDVNLIAEKAGLKDDGYKLQLTALCDAIRRGRAYGLDSSEIKVAIRDAYNWDGYDTAQLYDFQPILFE